MALLLLVATGEPTVSRACEHKTPTVLSWCLCISTICAFFFLCALQVFVLCCSLHSVHSKHKPRIVPQTEEHFRLGTRFGDRSAVEKHTTEKHIITDNGETHGDKEAGASAYLRSTNNEACAGMKPLVCSHQKLVLLSANVRVLEWEACARVPVLLQVSARVRASDMLSLIVLEY